MAVASDASVLTEAFLLTLSSQSDGARYEVVDGELHELNPSGADHVTVASRAARLIDEYAEGRAGRAFGAEGGFLLAGDTSDVKVLRAPDAAYVAAERARAQGSTPGFWPGAPDLAVEVVSPGDTTPHTHEKALMWLEYGTQVVLLVDPASRHVTRYRSRSDIIVFADDEPIDCGPAMPGFTPTPNRLIPAF